MASKYKDYYKEMLAEHKDLFTQFKEIHDNFVENEEQYKPQFNTVGQKVVEIARDYERRLCAHSEGGMYGKYSATLADKFWNEIRKTYPRIDFVGVK